MQVYRFEVPFTSTIERGGKPYRLEPVGAPAGDYRLVMIDDIAQVVTFVSYVPGAGDDIIVMGEDPSELSLSFEPHR